MKNLARDVTLADMLTTGQVKTLSLDLYADFNELAHVVCQRKTLTSLKKLEIKDTTLGVNDLGKFLSNCVSLEELTLHECKRSIHANAEENRSFILTTKLTFIASRLDNAFLNQLLSITPYLKELALFADDNNKTPDLISLQPFSLPLLEKISISSSDEDEVYSVDSSLLNQLLATASEMKQLHLKGTNLSAWELDDGVFQSPPNGQFKKLKQLDLSTTGIQAEICALLLSASPELEIIDVEGCNLDDLIQHLDDNVRYDSLRVLNIANSGLDDTAYEQLIQRAKNLRHLTLHDNQLAEDTLQSLKESHLQLTINTLDYESETYASEPGSEADDLPQHGAHQSVVPLDADTAPPNLDENITVSRYFYPAQTANDIHVSQYRLNAYDLGVINPSPCHIDAAFQLGHNTTDLALENRTINVASHDVHESLNQRLMHAGNTTYYGKYRLKLTHDWQALPSISANEIMTDYHLSDNVPVDIQYSTRDNLYYIRLHERCKQPLRKLSIDFIVEIPKLTPMHATDDLNQIIKFSQSLKQFKCEALQTDPSRHYSGHDYFQMIWGQQVGACRHRSFIFKHMMQTHFPHIPCRIIDNDCHSYNEIQLDAQWLSVNSGGYAANLEIVELDEPKTTPVAIDAIQLPTTSFFSAPQTIENKICNAEDIAHLFQSDSKTILLQSNSTQKLGALRHQLQKQAYAKQQPCFYIHSAQALICSSTSIQREANDTGRFKHGPSGPLHDFLTHNLGNSLLIVNYDQLTPSELATFNALLDVPRKADCTLVPTACQLVGLYNPTRPDAYQGADFYSRFEHKVFYSNIFSELIIPDIVNLCREGVQPFLIEFYGSNAWKEQLLGHWRVEGDQFTFIPGELEVFLHSAASTLELSNAPFYDPEFVCFWETARLTNSVDLRGKILTLPANFSLLKREGYQLNTRVAIELTNKSEHVLNPGLIYRLFAQYQVKDNQLYSRPGLIEAAKNSTLALYVTHPLSEPSWMRVLDAVARHNVRLQLQLAEGVLLPAAIGNNIPITSTHTRFICAWSNDELGLHQAIYIHSTDRDATLNSIATQHDVVIDISEVEPANLIKKIHPTFNQHNLTLTVKELKGALQKAVDSQKRVILTGHFSKNLEYSLTDYINSTQALSIILITTQENLFPTLKPYRHSVDLEANRTFTERRAHTICENPWQGMQALTVQTSAISDSYHLSHAKNVSMAFDYERMSAVEQILSRAPFVFLAGMSGVGKTSFMKNVWMKKHPKLFIGADKINLWAGDRTSSHEYKILFIDEANTLSREWSEFEGLFNSKPAISIENEYIELTPHHKVIFAGNPLSYGSERNMPALFKRHGNSVLFRPMPLEYIYYRLLKPILEGHATPEQIARPILAVAHYLTRHSTDDVLITPREIISMALFTRNHYDNQAEALDKFYFDIDDNELEDPVAAYYAYQLSQHLVPDSLKRDFSSRFERARPHGLVLNDMSMDGDFLPTTSNLSAREALADFITCRPQHGGLGGLIIEGEPGIGKSQMVQKTLESVGIAYDHIPVSMPYTEKKARLLHAFNQGNVVVIDEINTTAMMEDLLNNLLMGLTPDGDPPDNMGFLLIGTQNPTTMAGRAKISPAITHRLLTVTLPNYTVEEMQLILRHKKIPMDVAERMTQDYVSLKDNMRPKLCFRDLLRRAQVYLVEQASSEHIKKHSLDGMSFFTSNKKIKQESSSNFAFNLVA